MTKQISIEYKCQTLRYACDELGVDWQYNRPIITVLGPSGNFTSHNSRLSTNLVSIFEVLVIVVDKSIYQYILSVEMPDHLYEIVTYESEEVRHLVELTLGIYGEANP